LDATRWIVNDERAGWRGESAQIRRNLRHLAHRPELLAASLACNNNDLAISDNYLKFKILAG
jgi:hypothetical protein